MEYYVPEGYCDLFTVFNALGRSMFPDEWTGNEGKVTSESWCVETPEEIEIVRGKIVWDGDRWALPHNATTMTDPSLAPIWQKNNEMLQHAKRVWRRIRRYLAEGKLPGRLMNYDGKIVPVPKYCWAVDDRGWHDACENGRFKFSEGIPEARYGGVVLFRPDEITAAFSGRSPLTSRDYRPAIKDFLRPVIDGFPDRSPEGEQGNRLSKTDLLEACRAELNAKVPETQFNEAWKQLAPPSWKAPGRGKSLR